MILTSVRVGPNGHVIVTTEIRGKPRCATCGIKRPIHQSPTAESKPSLWRHLDLGDRRLYIEASVRRVYCKRCKTTATEQLPWAAPGSRFSYHFEDTTTWLTTRLDKTAAHQFMGIDWKTVGRIIERVVGRRREPVDYSKLTTISVDEISYRKGHRYLTLVVDLQRGRVIWGKEGKSANTLKAFFEEIGEEACSKIDHCAIDLGAAFTKAVRESLPNTTLVYDRFHVQGLVADAVDEMRREEWRNTEKGSSERKALKGLRYCLLKNPWNLTRKQSETLSSLQASNKRLYRAYLLKESFIQIFRQLLLPDAAEAELKKWLSWAARSQLKPFVKAAKTIRKHFEGILAYFETGYTTSSSEGFNNKARLATRRAYGFHSAGAFLAMIELTCMGVNVPLPRHAQES